MPSERKTVLVPRDFVVSPLFPAYGQPGRSVVIGGRKWEFGVPNPLKPGSGETVHLDIRHGAACFTLLSFRDLTLGGSIIPFSLNEFCLRLFGYNDGKAYRMGRTVIGDLRDCWIRITEPDGSSRTFTIIESIEVLDKVKGWRNYEKTMEFWLDRIRLHPEFMKLLNDIERIANIRIDVLNGISSPVAKSIYAFIPSRAAYRTRGNPFQITLGTLLEQVGCRPPRFKSQRKRMFTQHDHPVISQLDGAGMLSGILHVKLEETGDKSDWKLVAWSEKRSPPEWISKELDEYEAGKLEMCGIDIERSGNFLKKSKFILGEGLFREICAEVASKIAEGYKIDNPAGYLISKLKREMQ
ncbi:MAG TPA: hypothetical protein DET40_24410 [Lentisphaeria bacterium]|nr:MAG: hypothetical protein A2X45_00165 [Lentisphaerae bacterium GWF2_50_93]HCE46703.1 hypothetical protein [Lentisphaeria bacterium]